MFLSRLHDTFPTLLIVVSLHWQLHWFFLSQWIARVIFTPRYQVLFQNLYGGSVSRNIELFYNLSLLSSTV